MISQYKNCQASASLSCEIWANIDDSTAFVAASGSTLWTAYHAVRSYIESANKRTRPGQKIDIGFLKYMSLPFLLTDSNRKVILSSLRGDVLQISRVDVRVLDYQEGDEDQDAFDFVQMSLPRAFTSYLKIAQTPLVGSTLFTVGFPFPATTNRKDRLGTPDNDGFDLYSTFGKLLDLKGLRSLLMDHTAKDEHVSVEAEINIEAFILSDSQTGMSGGPIFNSDGEVIGIHTSAAYSLHHPRTPETNIARGILFSAILNSKSLANVR